MTQAFIHTSVGKPRECPVCHDLLTMATGVRFADDNAALARPVPTVGALTICGGCATLLVFTEDGLRAATTAEYESANSDVKRLIQQMMALAHRRQRLKRS
jgi:hypothetical protein